MEPIHNRHSINFVDRKLEKINFVDRKIEITFVDRKWKSILQTEKWRKWKLKRLRSLLVALPWKRARLVDFLNENSIIAVKGRF